MTMRQHELELRMNAEFKEVERYSLRQMGLMQQYQAYATLGDGKGCDNVRAAMHDNLDKSLDHYATGVTLQRQLQGL